MIPQQGRVKTVNTEKQKTESLLLQELKAGNEQAFASLFDQYSERLYFVAYKYLRDKDESEEIVQEVFYAVWKSRASIQPDLPFVPYLIRIAKNLIINQARKKLVKNTYLDYYVSQHDQSISRTENEVLFSEVKEIVQREVDALPPKRKAIFIESRINGLSNKEIAAKLTLSERTVENQINKALKTLRKKLKTYGYFSILLLLFAFTA